MRLLKLLFFIALIVSPLNSSGEDRARQGEMVRAAIDPDGVQRVEIVGGGYFFSPAHIVVKVNVPVELRVRKEAGITPHNIVMKSPDAGIDFDVALGEEPKKIPFVPRKTGVFPFYCSKKLLFFESHREKGMEGVLEVVE